MLSASTGTYYIHTRPERQESTHMKHLCTAFSRFLRPCTCGSSTASAASSTSSPSPTETSSPSPEASSASPSSASSSQGSPTQADPSSRATARRAATAISPEPGLRLLPGPAPGSVLLLRPMPGRAAAGSRPVCQREGHLLEHGRPGRLQEGILLLLRRMRQDLLQPKDTAVSQTSTVTKTRSDQCLQTFPAHCTLKDIKFRFPENNTYIVQK